MCGIAGLFEQSSQSFFNLSEIVKEMANAIQHRGPDDAGVWDDKGSRIALGHRRLSILDLSSAGHQPMHCQNGRYVIVFNGEIYNHLSLRLELENGEGAPIWRGHSDTETLLAAFSAWGIVATLGRTVGMFALALWDRHARCLTLARDRLGEKPLFYGWVGSTFVFGSELKALRAHPGFDNPISREVLALYLERSVIPAPYSIYKDIFKLEPGHYLSLSESDLHEKTMKCAAYWRPSDAAQQGLKSLFTCESEALLALEATLGEAVASQSIADVPVGAFLSGGIDSSIIATLLQNQSSRAVQTFSVGFEDAGYDEAPYARAVAEHIGTDHHEFYMTALDAQQVIPFLPSLYDEPFADSSQLPTYLICKAARQHVKVALTGDGGDELFGGYNRYLWGPQVWNKLAWLSPALRNCLGVGIQKMPIHWWDKVSRLIPKEHGVANLGQKAHQLAHKLKAIKNEDEFYTSLVTEWPKASQVVEGLSQCFEQTKNGSFFSNDAQHRMMMWDTLNYLPNDILVKVDRAAMGVGLESRVPFLDHRVMALAWRLPLHMKIRKGQGKWALRQVLYKHVPRELIERPKMGFSVPIGTWLRGTLREWAEDLLNERRLTREGYLNPKLIREMWVQHLSGRYNWTNRLWGILMFQAWLEVNS